MKMGQPISHTLGLEFVTILGSWNPLKIKWDFSSGPVAKTPHSQWRGPRFDPQSGN